MQAPPDLAPDWRDAAAYRPLLEADRSLFAWEWLRRTPAYRDAWQNARNESGKGRAASAAAFGLVAFEPPVNSVPEARPCWRANVFPYVLEIEVAEDLPAAERVDIHRLEMSVVRHAIDCREHLLLTDGLRLIRLDGPVGSFASEAVGLRYRISGLAGAHGPLLVLQRLLALCRTGRFASSLHPPETRAARWILMLRTQDALVSGASQREIAELLLSRSAGEARWRTREPSLRSRTQRLVRTALLMHQGKWREFLR